MPVHAPAFYTTSARASKTDIEPVDPGEVLHGVETLSICSWELDADSDDSRHVGPMAGEFANQFDLGGEGSIATADADGIAFAAIQGLSERLDQREAHQRPETGTRQKGGVSTSWRRGWRRWRERTTGAGEPRARCHSRRHRHAGRLWVC